MCNFREPCWTIYTLFFLLGLIRNSSSVALKTTPQNCLNILYVTADYLTNGEINICVVYFNLFVIQFLIESLKDNPKDRNKFKQAALLTLKTLLYDKG